MPRKKTESPPAEEVLAPVGAVPDDVSRTRREAQFVEADVSADAGPGDRVSRTIEDMRAKSSEIVMRKLLHGLEDIPLGKVQHALDEAIGMDAWAVRFETFGSACVQCHLSVRIAGAFVTKSAIGQPQDGNYSERERREQAVAEAFGEALWMFGVGTYVKVRESDPKPAAAAATPKPEPAKPAPVDPNVRPASEAGVKVKLKELCDYWTAQICDCDTPDALNTMLQGSAAKSMPAWAKKDVFAHIKEEAEGAGWKFSRKDVKFYAPEPEPTDTQDGIPF